MGSLQATVKIQTNSKYSGLQSSNRLQVLVSPLYPAFLDILIPSAQNKVCCSGYSTDSVQIGEKMTKIDIISGFLGAGKTTLIKKLLKEALAGTKVVLIENEYSRF